MRKIFTFLVVVLTLAGSAYAAIMIYNLFPDTRDFPRIPATPGTLGYSIAQMLGVTDIKNYVGDGTVTNTERLNGIPGTGYLQHNRCTTPRDVWLGVGTDGVPLCGAIGSLLAVEIGTLTGVVNTVTVIKPDGTSNPGADGDTLYVGDIITTAESSSGAIVFTDASLIRLDELTTVELDLGENTDGQEVAQIILANGDLWGRVLTTEGMNFEAGGYIAGVRGTSISVTKDNTDITVLIVDSTITTDRAAALYYNGQVSSAVNISAGSRILATSGTTLATPPATPPTITTPGKVDLLTRSDWASRNTIADIEYLLGIQGDSTLATTIQEKIENEFDVTVPALEDTSTCIATQGGDGRTDCDSDDTTSNIPSELLAGAGTLLNPEQQNARKELKGLNMLCREKYNGVFWPTIGKCVKNPTGTQPIIFSANYSNTYDSQTYIDMPVISRLLLPIEATLAHLELKGRTIRIKPRYEEYSESIIDETGQYNWASCIEKENGQPADVNPKATFGEYDSVKFESAICQNKYPSLSISDEKRIVYSKVYRTKNPTSTLTNLWNNTNGGVNISTAGQYISYPLSEFPGGASFLRGKTIELSLDGIPTVTSTILDLGTSIKIIRFVNGSASDWYCYFGGVGGTYQKCGSTVISSEDSIIKIKIPTDIKAEHLVIGNKYPILDGPIQKIIKSIKIYN